MLIKSTNEWLRDLEAKIFPSVHSEKPLQKEYVINFLKKTTVMNELMHNEYDDYISTFVNDIYANGQTNNHGLKSFVMLDYPIAAIESAFKKEHKPKIRDVKATIFHFPKKSFSKVPIITAGATRQPITRNGVIFLTEWLFAFLWDYFHSLSEIFPLGTPFGKVPAEDEQKIHTIRINFCNKLSTRRYKNWDTSTLINKELYTNSPRWEVLFALIFIFGHELGHLFLNHNKNTNLITIKHLTESGEHIELKTYNISQEQEFDADMFASDVYFKYLMEAITFKGDSNWHDFIMSGFEFLYLLAITEGLPNESLWRDKEHPPSSHRLYNIVFRHKELFLEYGLSNLQESLEQIIAKSNINSKYDYSKDLGTKDFLI